MKWGLISQLDSETLMKTADLVCEQFANDSIEFTEIGIYAGLSGNALTKYFTSKNIPSWWNGIDNSKDGQELLFKPDNFIKGNSNEVYNQLKDESQHLIFVDGCHCFTCVIADFYAYERKVKQGCYLCFHDTGRHIKPFKDFQHGDRDNPFAYISVRAALERIGLLGNRFPEWRLILDEADENDEAGGICVFKKVAKWD